ncbi:MAG: MFS transporter [Balneolaceae bacterium]
MTYLAFALKERRLLSFAVSLTFFSSFGQTFLISLFVPFFLGAFHLTNATFGTLYSAATLLSAFMLPYLGQMIDRISLRNYSLAVAGALVAAALLMAAAWHIAILFLALVLLRLAGQGLSGHTAQTAMARYYDHHRGKALSISNLGYPMGEGVLPIAIAGLLALVHWRVSWLIIAGCIAFLLIPALWALVRNDARTHHTGEEADRDGSAWDDYRLVFSESRLPFILPAILLPPFWITGIFLYQVSTAEQLGWSAALIASAFVAFAVARIVFGLIAGPLVDRFTAQKVFPFLLLPMIGGLLIGAAFSAAWAAFLYMALFGVTMGFAGTIKSALWAEMFGVERIGTVRSLFSSLMVFATAVSPMLVGWMLDSGTDIVTILYYAAVTSLAGALLSFRLFKS